MSRKPKRPWIGGLRADGPRDAIVCCYCFDLGHRRPRKPWKDPETKMWREGCPGCGGRWEPEESEALAVGLNAAAIEAAAWELLGDQRAREEAGVSTYEEAARYVVDVVESPFPKKPEGKPPRTCNRCYGQSWRRPIDVPCACGEVFAPEMIPVATGLASTMAGIPELDSIA